MKINASPRVVVAVPFILAASAVLGGFAGTDVFLASVGRRAGAAGSDWYTTVWVNNPNSTAADVQFFFLERDRDNSSPAVYNATIQGGDTVRYEDAVALMFGVESFGAIRVVSSQRLVVNSRIYSRPPGGELRDSQGQFFAAVPATFAIAEGESTRLLGAYQTAPKPDSQFRYNFGFVEAAGGSARVRVTASDATGVTVASKEYDLRPFEPRQFPLEDLLPGVDAENLTLTVEVVSGNGRVIAFGSGLANRSNDPSTFEMQFPDTLLAANSPVVHDDSLSGDGSATSPLAIASGGVEASHIAAGTAVTSINGAADDLTVTGTGGVSVSTAGQTLTISGTAAGGAVCPQCVESNIFSVSGSYPAGDTEVFTVPSGKTRYITGVHPAISCETADSDVSVQVVYGATQHVNFTLTSSPWVSGGGAPLVVKAGEKVRVRVFSLSQCSVLVTITGFEM